MKTYITLLAALAVSATAGAYTPVTLPVIPADPAIEAKVQKTLSSMTLDQKIGQMLQLQIDVVGSFDSAGNFTLDPAKVDSVISTYKVGSFLNRLVLALGIRLGHPHLDPPGIVDAPQ